jgi:UDP-N-acetylglucosamine 2-epimerase
MEKSIVVLMDNSGIQEKAPGFSKPVIVMCNTTERPEALESGTPIANEMMSKAVNLKVMDQHIIEIIKQ